jgi:hypothetical protein
MNLAPPRLALALIVASAGAVAHAQPPRPADGGRSAADATAAEGTLAARGLRRVGNLYLLQAERDAQAKLRDLRRRLAAKAGEMKNAARAAAQAQAQLDGIQGRMAELQNQRDQFVFFLNNQAPAPQPAAQARLELRRINDLITQTNIRVATLEQNAQNYALQASNLEEEARQAQGELDDLVADLEAQYREVAADAEVFEALMAVNRRGRPWATLGPEAGASGRLAQLAERALTGAGLHVDARKRTAAAAGEAEFNAACHKAWVLGQRLKGREADAARAELAALVPTLRPMADEIRAVYDALPRDRLAADAVAEYAAATKVRLRAGPSADFTKNLGRLEELERLAEPAP